MGDEGLGVWEFVKLGDLVDWITKGATPTTYGHKWQEDGILFVRNECVRRGRFQEDGSLRISEAAHERLARSVIRGGDVLVTITGDVGRACVFPDRYGEANINQHIARVRLRDRANALPRYVAHMINSPQVAGHFHEITRGVTHPHLSLGQVKETTIPLPPLDEQRRIVARIESLFDRMAEARRLRVAAEEEAGRLLEAELSQVFSTVVEKCGTELLGKHGPLITSGPRHWSRYAQASPPGPLFLRVGNVGFATLQLDDIEYLRLPENAGEQRARVQTGDVLITITGTIGRCAVVPPDLPEAFINQHTALVRLDQERILPHYLMWFVLSPVGGNQTDSAAYGQTKPGLNLTQLRELKLPLPSLSEQRRIVAYLDGVQAEVAELKRLQAASAADLERLEGAVLARAFGGEL
ncbi:MAG: restriction endonuclease subunit S [Anaerolineae bacterium]|nr:restriction endonuclease subunit S [Anaerolineae bacterium]